MPGRPVPAWEGLEGRAAGLRVVAPRSGLRKVRLRGGRLVMIRRLAYSGRYEELRETREFCVASASVLDMPPLWGSLRSCQVSDVAGGSL